MLVINYINNNHGITPIHEQKLWCWWKADILSLKIHRTIREKAWKTLLRRSCFNCIIHKDIYFYIGWLQQNACIFVLFSQRESLGVGSKIDFRIITFFVSRYEFSMLKKNVYPKCLYVLTIWLGDMSSLCKNIVCRKCLYEHFSGTQLLKNGSIVLNEILQSYL